MGCDYYTEYRIKYTYTFKGVEYTDEFEDFIERGYIFCYDDEDGEYERKLKEELDKVIKPKILNIEEHKYNVMRKIESKHDFDYKGSYEDKHFTEEEIQAYVKINNFLSSSNTMYINNDIRQRNSFLNERHNIHNDVEILEIRRDGFRYKRN